MCDEALPFNEINGYWPLFATFMEFSIQEAEYVLGNVDICLHQPTSSAEILDFLLFDSF